MDSAYYSNSVEDIVDNLNDIANTSRSVPYPPRNKRNWTAICRVDDQSIKGETRNSKKFAFGYGIDKSMTNARKKAEKMAKDKLGSCSVHHPACKCISSTGVINACGR